MEINYAIYVSTIYVLYKIVYSVTVFHVRREEKITCEVVVLVFTFHDARFRGCIEASVSGMSEKIHEIIFSH